ncbi:MAG TPA: hypothetical protein DDZ39_01695 [Flavobacteriaceae bacterium]|nr:hypothetical protein [Flavobacteriaceae bacterium]
MLLIMEKTDTFEKLKKFIIKETLVNDLEITTMTTLERDLGITGDDAWDLLEKYKNIFNVDISNFEFNEYFQEEGSWVLGWLFDVFKNKQRRTLTVGQLVEAINKGQLE